MKKTWTAFYVDEYQSGYFLDTENYKMYKCPNNYNLPSWSIYLIIFLCAVMSDLLNRFFMPFDNSRIGYLFVAVILLIGCIAVYLIMKYIGKKIGGLAFELNISIEQMCDYIDKGKNKFKRDIMVIGIFVGIAIFVLLISVWLFFILENTYILIVSTLTWIFILLCSIGFQPIKRYKLYKYGVTDLKNYYKE